VAAGLSHTGFGAGGAIGQIVAEWLVEGEPPSDVSEMSVRRFGPIYEERAYAAERARESYRYYYLLRYPHDENESVRERRLSPLDGRCLALGGVFGERNGWERVSYFEPGRPGRRAGAEQRGWGWGRPPFFALVGEEHRAVRERVGLVDMTSFGKIDVRGPGALACLQDLAGNDVGRPPGRVVYTQLLNPRGGIEADVTIVRLAEAHFRVISGSAFVPADLGWIRMHLPRDGSVVVREVTDELAVIGLWGPAARAVLAAVTRDDVSNAAFPYLTAREIRVAGTGVWAQRVTYVGELGWELYVAPGDAGAVWDALLEAGRPAGLRPVGYKALDSLRLEKGNRYWSADVTPADSPDEAGLGACVRLDKGEFVGRDALARLRSRPPARRLVTLAIDPAPTIYGGEAVWAGDRLLGRLRSGGYGYTVERNIGLVYLPAELAVPGTPLAVEVFGERVPAEVAPDVLYDPAGARVRA
jgi:4-methylaminobutanoate oxidase (formaldehyde-forming)